MALYNTQSLKTDNTGTLFSQLQLQLLVLVGLCVFEYNKLTTYSFVETNYGPKRAAKCAAAEHTATEQPPEVHGHGFLKNAVYTRNRVGEFLWRQFPRQRTRKFGVEATVQSKTENKFDVLSNSDFSHGNLASGHIRDRQTRFSMAT